MPPLLWISLFFYYFGCLSLLFNNVTRTVLSDENDLDKFIQDENEKFRIERSNLTIIHWNLESNLTQHNEDVFVAASYRFDEFRQKQHRRIKKFLSDAKNLNESAKRQLEKLCFLGFSILDAHDGREFQKAQVQMEKIYSSAKVDIGDRKDLSMEPDLNQMLTTSTNETLLKEIWVKYRDATGKKMREDFIVYYTLGNKAAKHLGEDFKTMYDVWMFDWENTDIKTDAENLMNDLMNLYEKIHAYVRFHLEKVYKDKMPLDGTIPAHLLGNMWAQTWSPLLSLIPSLQFDPKVLSLDQIINQKLKTWTARQMFELAEKFFTSLGMEKMTSTFWEKSIFEKQENVKMVCHASAWDFFIPGDFRIKQCTEKSLENLMVVHHEMGHIQYYMNYEKQPPVFREGANPGFHEAIGDLMAMSFITPKHLMKIGLLDKDEVAKNLEAMNLNYQLRMALDKISFLPFAFIMDKWRWDLFEKPELLGKQMNRYWWELRLKYQGISPPVKRSEEDFDPGSKYHIPAGVEYIRYFISHILQFQFYKRLCQYEKGLDKLYECDFYENLEAGKHLKEMLEKGSSEKWQKILEDFTGSSKITLDALNEYFSPLNQTLSKFIEENRIKVGWDAKVEDYFINGKSSASQIGTTSWLMIISLITYLILM